MNLSFSIPCESLPAKQKAFTLIELLMCIAVIAVLSALLIAQMPKLRLKSESVKTISNMRQIVAAMGLYANDHNGVLLPQYNSSGSDKETWRQRVIFQEGYIRDYEIFNNPTNRRLRDGGGLGGGNMFVTGSGKNTSFSSGWKIYTEWKIGAAVVTPETMYSDLNVPILWDHRADRLWTGNKMTTFDGNSGGHFAYADGEVRLIGPPSHVIRGEPDFN
ncbi:type II secretion system protein [Coraliomargarita parva]|uniref:type II secretion system protein n=1 Tax=Coraliomargarita parva TaxID=3014050 RepID=UPI0022B3367E|nr:type II secretion system protein [Coraliomargarita parva]